MKTRILLINPPSSRDQFIGSDNYFPLGLLSLATTLKKFEIDAKVVDVNNYFFNKKFNQKIFKDYIKDNLNKIVLDYKPDIIGIGCIFSGAFDSLLTIAEYIKNNYSDIPIVAGGIHPTVFGKEILEKHKFIDYVIVGEGEYTFLNLIKSIVSNDTKFESINGISYRIKGEVFLNPKTEFIENINDIPPFDFSLLEMDDYNLDTSGWYSPKNIDVGQPFPIITSRSCPNRCTFCSMRLVHGPRIRFRNSEEVLDEMENLYEKYNARYFQFMDDNLTYNKQRILDICNGILERNMDIQFDTPNGVAMSRLDDEIIESMVKAGLVRISVAIESGSEYIRNKVMRKGLKTEKIYEVMESIEKYDHVFINGFFIIGMPQDTHETLQETYDIITELSLDKFATSFATPFPGTELFKYCLDHDLLPYKEEEYVDIKDLQGRSDYPHFKPHELTCEDLVEFRDKCQNYLKKKRREVNLPNNYPLRYKGVKYESILRVKSN